MVCRSPGESKRLTPWPEDDTSQTTRAHCDGPGFAMPRYAWQMKIEKNSCEDASKYTIDKSYGTCFVNQILSNYGRCRVRLEQI